jgi:hypothetical protein
MNTAGWPGDSAETYAALVPVALMGPGRLALLAGGVPFDVCAWRGAVAWEVAVDDAEPGVWAAAVEPATINTRAADTERDLIRELLGDLNRMTHDLTGRMILAISSLEFGSSGAQKPTIIETPNAGGRRSRKRRKMSAAARAKISAAQGRRWAKVRAAKNH